MDKKFLSDSQKKRIKRMENVILEYAQIKEYEPEAPKYKIVEHLAKKHKVKKSTIRNILKQNAK